MEDKTLCSQCGERIAVLFIGANSLKSKDTKGYCLSCASKMGIKEVDKMLENMNLSQEDFESMEKDMQEMLKDIDFEQMNEMVSEIAIPLKMDEDGKPDFEGMMEELGQNEEVSNKFKEFKELMAPIHDTNSDSDDDEKPNFYDASGNLSGSLNKARQEREGREGKKPKRKYLNNFCTDLTEKARSGKLDRVIGREKEIARSIQILNRRSKNNPCFIGEPGVGKTAIVEGIANKIANGDVPLRLADKEIFQLDLTSLVAGTQFRGQFESRVKGLLEEVLENGNIILFVDEVHNLVGAGESEGAMSAANIFKPALSRGEIQVIGATTFTEYRKYIEKDTALERRFQPITVNEPSVKETAEILKGVKDYYEKHHRIIIPNKVIHTAAVLAERYITDRFLPDKAIDLIDEAASYKSLASAVIDRHDELLSKKKILEEEVDEMMTAEEIDYQALATKRVDISKIDEDVEMIRPELESVELTEDDIAKVIELWTGISYAKIKKSELAKVSNIEDKLGQRVVGQKEAIELVARAVKRSRVQISARRRPASFLFVGPTAVGKTELVKVLADELFDGPDPLIRLDMSEFMEQHSVSKMIGSPPGYVGYDDAGQLTERVRRRPHSVILFDEIEKAHPNVMNILLQILDEGHITDSQGRIVNFENTIIIMTSNAGSQFIDSAMGFNKSKTDMNVEKTTKALKEFLRPEFLSRVDEVVVFNPLTKENYVQIAKLALEELKKSVIEQDIVFSYDEDAVKYIGNKAYGDASGARMIRKIIQKEVEDEIAGIIIDDPMGYEKELFLTTKGEGLVFLDASNIQIRINTAQ